MHVAVKELVWRRAGIHTNYQQTETLKTTAEKKINKKISIFYMDL